MKYSNNKSRRCFLNSSVTSHKTSFVSNSFAPVTPLGKTHRHDCGLAPNLHFRKQGQLKGGRASGRGAGGRAVGGGQAGSRWAAARLAGRGREDEVRTEIIQLP